jgi:hypothetical protein
MAAQKQGISTVAAASTMNSEKSLALVTSGSDSRTLVIPASTQRAICRNVIKLLSELFDSNSQIPTQTRTKWKFDVDLDQLKELFFSQKSGIDIRVQVTDQSSLKLLLTGAQDQLSCDLILEEGELVEGEEEELPCSVKVEEVVEGDNEEATAKNAASSSCHIEGDQKETLTGTGNNRSLYTRSRLFQLEAPKSVSVARNCVPEPKGVLDKKLQVFLRISRPNLRRELLPSAGKRDFMLRCNKQAITDLNDYLPRSPARMILDNIPFISSILQDATLVDFSTNNSALPLAIYNQPVEKKVVKKMPLANKRMNVKRMFLSCISKLKKEKKVTSFFDNREDAGMIQIGSNAMALFGPSSLFSGESGANPEMEACMTQVKQQMEDKKGGLMVIPIVTPASNGIMKTLVAKNMAIQWATGVVVVLFINYARILKLDKHRPKPNLNYSNAKTKPEPNILINLDKPDAQVRQEATGRPARNRLPLSKKPKSSPSKQVRQEIPKEQPQEVPILSAVTSFFSNMAESFARNYPHRQVQPPVHIPTSSFGVGRTKRTIGSPLPFFVRKSSNSSSGRGNPPPGSKSKPPAPVTGPFKNLRY